MKNLNYSILLLVAVSCVSIKVNGQTNRIEPGRMYESGEKLFAPHYGFTAKVPEGWDGMLPRESEVFLLTSATASVFGEIYVFGRDRGDLSAMADAWVKGFDLSENIRLKSMKPVLNDGMLSAEVIAEGEYVNKQYKGFAASRCSDNGPCITLLAVAPEQFIESVKNTAIAFLKSGSFQAPSDASPYTDFNWTEFLSGKVLATYTSIKGGTKESMIHLCADGTFQSDIKKGGILKNQNPKYRGRQSGKWLVTGTGEEAAIKFTFSKKDLAPFEALLKIKDEKVYSNSERYFVGKSDKCK